MFKPYEAHRLQALPGTNEAHNSDLVILQQHSGFKNPATFPFNFYPCALLVMASKWQVADLMQEVDAMVALLSKRGKGCSHMATSLTDQLQKKMDSASLSTNEVLQLSDHLVAAGLPEACKDELLASCDKLAMKESHPSSAVKLQLQQQNCQYLVNYLTAADWQSLQKEPLWPNVNVLVKRLKHIGVKSVKEGLKKLCLGILVLMHLQQNSGMMPKYRQIYQLGQHFSQAFVASSEAAKPGVPSLLNYPERPEMISPDFVSKAYNAGDPPVSKDLPDLNYLVLNHIPVRSTSKLLLQEEASPTKNLVFSKKDGRRGDENFQTMAAGVVSKVEQMLQNFAAGTAGGQAKLQDKSSTFQSDSVMFQPKQKALALPSTMVQTTPSCSTTSRPAKFARLESLRRKSPYVSQSALAGIIADIRDNGLPDNTSRASMQRATQLSLEQHDQYGPLLEKLQLPNSKGGSTTVYVTNVATYLAALYRSDSYRDLLLRAFALHPCSYQKPWGLCIYSDEIVPGNVLGPASRKPWGVYANFVQNSLEDLGNELSWMVLCCARTSLVNEVEGAMSHLMAAIVKNIFCREDYDPALGILLPSPAPGLPPLRLFFSFQMVLQDGASQKATWCSG